MTGRLACDGKPVTNAIVLFQDNGRGIHIKAVVDGEGRFEVSMAAGYGLPLGKYAVAVRPTTSQPPASQGPVHPSSTAPLQQGDRCDIPDRCRDIATSGLTITVERGGGDFSIEMASDAGAK